jgi:eukaryotic-like serine/threonine-protein kinase
VTEEQRLRSEELFLEAMEVSPDEPMDWVEAACGGDRAILEEVVSLLGAAEDANGFFASLAAGVGAPFDAGPSTDTQDSVGREVGPYRLLREVGRGGSGTVYLAERVDGEFEQRVAIKLLRRGLDTDDVLARFRAERQILASLNHPNIARLLDGGATSDGRPFLVMELVEGLPITDYCDERRCDIRARLRLFVQVARAVQHAHGHLVVHRDIKPGNILVTESGTPKLLDFGIARLLDDSDDAADGARTRTGARLLTPEYASPEQVRGEPVGTASDAFQLGILLYRLLSGRRPWAGRGLDRLERREAAPPPAPSQALTQHVTGEPTTGEIARLRSTDPRKLHALLRGDLDTIVLRAVRTETERRYATAAELADDVERYLAGLPVAAQPDSWTYRTRKLVARRPGPVAAAVAAVLALAAYGATVSVHAERLELERNLAREAAIRAGQERDRAEAALQEAQAERRRARLEYERAESESADASAARLLALADRDRAETQAARAEQVTEFLVGLFESADPAHAPAADASARDLLNRGLDRVDALTGQPDVQAELALTMARAYHSLGFYEDALSLVERVLASGSARLAQALPLADALAEQAELLHHRGDYPGAERIAEQVMAIRRRHLASEHPDIARSLNQLAVLQRRMGRLPEAERLNREALAMRQRLLGREHREVAESLSNLGLVVAETGRLAEAEDLYRESLAIRRRLLGPHHPDLAFPLNNLAILLARNGRFEEAMALYRESLALERRALGEDHPEVASTLHNLAALMRRMDRDAEAAELYREALAIRRRSLGDAHPAVAATLTSLGIIMRRMGRGADAEAMHRESLTIRRRVFGEGHPDVAQSMGNLGVALGAAGRFGEAEELIREALAIRRRVFGDEHTSVAVSLHQLGLLLRDRGETDAAASSLREALELRTRLLGADHPETASTRNVLEGMLGGATTIAG